MNSLKVCTHLSLSVIISTIAVLNSSSRNYAIEIENQTPEKWQIADNSIGLGASIDPFFRKTYQYLLSRTKTIAILLPKKLPGKLVGLQTSSIFLTIIDESPNSYKIVLGNSPDCRAEACYLGSFNGTRLGNGQDLIEGEKVILTRNITGYYQTVGRGGRTSRITWVYGNAVYFIELKGTKNDIIELAKSSIASVTPQSK